MANESSPAPPPWVDGPARAIETARSLLHHSQLACERTLSRTAARLRGPAAPPPLFATINAAVGAEQRKGGANAAPSPRTEAPAGAAHRALPQPWPASLSLPQLKLNLPWAGRGEDPTAAPNPLADLSLAAAPAKGAAAKGPVSKGELGGATWTLLHTLAAQWPLKPTRQQKKDAKMLINTLTRIYPCADCAKHFQEIVKANPPRVDSGPDFQVWMCEIHNSVNRRVGKPMFNCGLVASRWGELDCDDKAACDLTVVTHKKKKSPKRK